MSTKPVGTQELVFATITKMIPGKNSVAIYFEHATNGNEIIHRLSMDKLKYQNCYSDIEVGQTYIIVETLERPTRWVWTKARMCTKTQARKVFNMTGINPNTEAMIKAMTWLSAVQRGTKVPDVNSIIDQLVTF